MRRKRGVVGGGIGGVEAGRGDDVRAAGGGGMVVGGRRMRGWGTGGRRRRVGVRVVCAAQMIQIFAAIKGACPTRIYYVVSSSG